MAPRNKLKAKATENCNAMTRTRKTSKNSPAPPPEKPLLKRVYTKSHNTVTVKVSPFPKQTIDVIAGKETKRTAKLSGSTSKRLLKRTELKVPRQSIRHLKNEASEVAPAINQVVGTTSLLAVSESTLLTKRKGRPKKKKSHVKETVRALDSDHKIKPKRADKLGPKAGWSLNSKLKPVLKKTIVRKRNTKNKEIKTIATKIATRSSLKSSLTEGKTTIQVKKQQECNANCKEEGNKRKRKIVTHNNSIKNVKRRKTSKIKFNSAVEENSTMEIEKAGTAIEQRLADSKQCMLLSDIASTCASKRFINKSNVKKRGINASFEPNSCRTFKSVKKRERKKKSLESDSCETFISHKSSSISDTFSWTKEISSSSTSFITVKSNDYVCIDRKLPIIKLHNVERSSPDTTVKTPEPITTHIQKNTFLSETETESSIEYSNHTSRTDKILSNTRECPSNCKTNNFIKMPKIPRPTLNLSTTTSPSQMQSTTEVTTDTDVTSDTDIMKSRFIESYLENIQPHCERESTERDVNDAILKRVDLAFIEWLGIGNTLVMDVNDQIYETCSDTLNAEVAVIDECLIIKKQLSKFLFKNKEDSQGNVLCYPNYLNRESALAKEDDGKETDNGKMPQTNLNNDAHALLEDSEGNKKSLDATSQNYDDDDDALSLFAESLDLNRLSHSTSTEKNRTKTSEISDEPSQILHTIKSIEKKYENEIQNNERKSKDAKQSLYTKTKLICEKQNADSTSINKEDKTNDNEQIFIDHTFCQNKDKFKLDNSINKIDGEPPKGSEAVDNANIKLMSCYCSAKNPIKSLVFGGVCFFNLSSTCKYKNCYFPHRELVHSLVKMRLERQDNTNFMQEYMLARKFPKLRDKYIYLFIENCTKRNLPRILMEMSIDSILKDTIITRTYYLEAILLAFNDIDMSACMDVLFYKFETTCLCDIFLETIVFNQNFTRFIQLFIKLVSAKIDKHSHIEVSIAIQTLERVCILAYNEALIKTVLRIFSHTADEIFSHSLLGRFEEMLSQVNSDLYEEFVVMKKAAISPSDSLIKEYSLIQPQTCKNLKINGPLPQDINGNKRYTSPDTTLLESVNKINDKLALHTHINAPIQSVQFTSQTKPREIVLKPSKFEFRNDKFSRSNIMTEKNVFSKQKMYLRPDNPKEDINWCPRTESKTFLLPGSSDNHRFDNPSFSGICRRRF